MSGTRRRTAQRTADGYRRPDLRHVALTVVEGQRQTIKTLRLPIVLLLVSLAVVGAVWVWLGAPMTFPRARSRTKDRTTTPRRKGNGAVGVACKPRIED